MGKKVKHVPFDKKMRAWAKELLTEELSKEELLQDLWTCLAEISRDSGQLKYFSELANTIEKGDAVAIRKLWAKVEDKRREGGHTVGVIDFNGKFVCMSCTWNQAKKYGRSFSVREIVTWQDASEWGSGSSYLCGKCGRTMGVDLGLRA